MKFAFIIKGNFDMSRDCASIQNGVAQIIGVANTQQACEIAKKLVADGVKCIELCGVFTENDVEQVIQATENNTPIGYVTHLKKQDELYKTVFNL